MNERSVARRRRTPPLFALLAVAFLLGVAGPAAASATSGYIYKLTTGPYSGGTYARNCIKADINDVADNVGNHKTVTTTSCSSSAYVLPAGYISARAAGYRDGAYCGSTGYAYNSGPTSAIGVGSHLCSNPSGTQIFRTVADGQTWTIISGTWQYAYVPSVTSPNQNY